MSQHLLRTSYLPGTVQEIYVFNVFNLHNKPVVGITVLSRCITVEDTERLRDLTKPTQLVSGRAGIQSQDIVASGVTPNLYS